MVVKPRVTLYNCPNLYIQHYCKKYRSKSATWLDYSCVYADDRMCCKIGFLYKYTKQKFDRENYVISNNFIVKDYDMHEMKGFD